MAPTRHLPSLLFLFGVVCSLVAAQGPGKTSSVRFNNGRSFDVNELLSDLDSMVFGAQSASAPRAGQTLFSSADVSAARDPSETTHRNIFDQGTGNEFVNNTDASQAAQTDSNQLRVLVDRTGLDTRQSFDASGNAVDEGVMQVSNKRVTNCPYDRANRLPCTDSFREPTARCTNMEDGKKTWGMARTPYIRVLPAAYEDGIMQRRKTEFTSAKTLPSPRKVSTEVTTIRVILNHDGFSSQIMQWGQFTGHEFTHLSELEADAACCPDRIFAERVGRDANPTREQLNEIREEIEQFRGDVCMQIEAENDPIFGNYVCMSQRRSRPAPLHDCSIGPRQQMNTITHVFDASAVYGSSKAEQDRLRDPRNNARMNTQTINGKILPPADVQRCSAQRIPSNKCPFLGGDTRINTTPNLIVTHTAFVVKHNQIVERLRSINKHWDNERLFQETRRIIAGIQTNIHYYEYLPIILGPEAINRHKIGSYQGFDPQVNPSVLSEMAHAAFRFGHSTIDGFFSVESDNRSSSFLNLREQFGKPDIIYAGGIRPCIKGLLKDIPWIQDRNFPTQMRDFMFNGKLDIVSLNINRGRDHGFQAYVEYRKHYGLSVPLTFEDMRRTHPEEVITAFRKVYSTVADVELYLGGVTEFPVQGGLVGELFANIMGDGFSRLMNGDRLFFESPHSGLSAVQVRAIKGYKYHQLLCETAEIPRINNNAFFTAGKRGSREVNCADLPALDLNLWKEEKQIQPTPQCHWQVVSEGACCFGERQITRKCVGTGNCRCQGTAVIKSRCSCISHSCYRNFWRNCRDVFNRF